MPRFLLLCCAAALTLAGCAPRNPPRWAEGGAQLAFAPARWEREGADPVELGADGHVFVDGDLTFVLDRVGRVADDDFEPLAVLLPDGHLAGQDNVSLGRVGLNNASPPGAVEAWLSVGPDGRVTYYSADGERANGGIFQGCGGPVHRTCTLVAQLVALQHLRVPRGGVGIGVGIGVGVGF